MSGCANRFIAEPGGSDHGAAQILAKNDKYIIAVADKHDTARSLAGRFLGDPDKHWVIEDANNGGIIVPHQAVVIPLQATNPNGFHAGGYQTVPVLAYHRIGNRATRMSVTREMFKRQMAYLHDNHYRVIPLARLIDFIQGKAWIPLRSVVLTFDDGHKSIYRDAFPVLKQYGYHTTVFVYSDYIENGGLTWAQLKEMTESGLISIQPHSKTHANLALRKHNEGEADYQARIDAEISVPTQRLNAMLPSDPLGFAYPFGDTNERVIATLRAHNYLTGLTVQPGGNPVFAYPYLLRRSMIFGDRDLRDFKARLAVFEPLPQP